MAVLRYERGGGVVGLAVVVERRDDIVALVVEEVDLPPRLLQRRRRPRRQVPADAAVIVTFCPADVLGSASVVRAIDARPTVRGCDVGCVRP